MRRPWNIVNTPVYSLATYAEGAVNMNICTYVTAISMKPKLYAVAVYYNTRTFDNLAVSDTAVLQVLSRGNQPLVRTLGKKSGRAYDKQAYLEKKDLLSTWNRLPVLNNACAYVLLHTQDRLSIGGDHELFIFKVERYRTASENDVLMFQDLVEANIIF